MINRFLINLPEQMESDRLSLRSYRAGDGSIYYEAGKRNQRHLTEFESGNVLMTLESEEHAESIVRELAAKWMSRECFFIGMFEKQTEKWAGQVYVGPTNWRLPEFTIGYVADVNFEGKGYASEAVRRVLKMLFEDVGAHRVKSDCNENNSRSARLLERCGFRKEGHLLENRKNPDGSFHGDFLFGMLRSDYEKIR